MATTEYLPVAVASGANVDSQGAFEGATYQLVGFTTGVARATQANKVWRQASMMSAAWANVIVNIMGQNVNDDGNLPNLISQLNATINQIVQAAINASGLLARIIACENNIVSLQNSFNTLNGTVNGLSGQVASLAARMSAAEGNIVGLQNNVNGLLSRMAAAEAGIVNNNNSISWLTLQVNSLIGRMGNAENAIAGINGSIADIYNRLANLDNAINGINSQIGGINTRLGGVDSHLGQLDSQVAQLMPQGDRNGWVSLPNGLIMQWVGGVRQNASGTLTQAVNFPRPFPNVCINIQVTTRWYGGQDNQIMIYQTTTWNNATVWLRRARRGDDQAADTQPYIFAVGY